MDWATTGFLDSPFIASYCCISWTIGHSNYIYSFCKLCSSKESWLMCHLSWPLNSPFRVLSFLMVGFMWVSVVWFSQIFLCLGLLLWHRAQSLCHSCTKNSASQISEWLQMSLPCPPMGAAFMVLHFICRAQHFSAAGRGHALRSLHEHRWVLAQRSWVTRISTATLNFWASIITPGFCSFLFIKLNYIFWTD